MAEAIEQFSQMKRAQRIVRLINLISAFSVVGLAITFIVMNAQFIFGNGMGISLVPKLEGIEIMLLLLLNFLILLIVLVIAGVLVQIVGGDTSATENIPQKSPENAAPQTAPVGGARSQL